MEPVEIADVMLWGRTIGAVAWDREREVGSFQYTREFQGSRIEVAPLTMPLGPAVYAFPELARRSFHGLPGLLADALPDKFGNLLIDQWLTRAGREPGSFSPIERLCYLGTRGMGALEFRPSLRRGREASAPVEIEALVALAADVLADRAGLTTRLGEADDETAREALRDILRVGTSAGGARAKAIIAWNEATGEVRSGQVKAPEGFSYWLLKFDGVEHNRDKELADPKGYGRIEYAYHLMAAAAGVEMNECRLLEENGRAHFITRRFDRTADGGKRFMQSLCGVAHYDFNQAGAYSYEQALEVAQRLGCGIDELRQLYRRMVFNVLGRNQDDHTKNIAFLMNRAGRWSLAPAFDVTFAFNPSGEWTSRHQMTLNGKRDGFTRADLMAVARRFRLGKPGAIEAIWQEVDGALGHWSEHAAAANVSATWVRHVASSHRRLAVLPKE